MFARAGSAKFNNTTNLADLRVENSGELHQGNGNTASAVAASPMASNLQIQTGRVNLKPLILISETVRNSIDNLNSRFHTDWSMKIIDMYFYEM
jgi:hypothetical protein